MQDGLQAAIPKEELGQRVLQRYRDQRTKPEAAAKGSTDRIPEMKIPRKGEYTYTKKKTALGLAQWGNPCLSSSILHLTWWRRQGAGRSVLRESLNTNHVPFQLHNHTNPMISQACLLDL